MNRCHQSTNMRGLVSSDLPRCCELSPRYTQREINDLLRDRDTVGRVVEYRGRVISFVIYAKKKWLVEILDIGHDPEYRDEAVCMVIYLRNRIRDGWGLAKELICVLPEDDLDNQLLLRDSGLTARVMSGSPTYYRFGWKV